MVSGCCPSEGYTYNISHLSSQGEDGDTDAELRTAVSLVPGVAGVTITNTRSALIG